MPAAPRRGGSPAGGIVLSALAALAAMGAAVSARAASCAAPGALEVGPFSQARPGGPLPTGWGPLSFPGVAHTRYTLVRLAGHGVVVRAQADASASGLVRRIRIDPRRYPRLCWSWRIANLIPGSDVHRRDGDDYPGRVYVTFDYPPARLGLLRRLKYDAVRLLYGEAPPLRAITYIWAARAPKGAIVPSPYTGDDRMIVVESGAAQVGRWVREARNVAEDYRRAFHEPAPGISGVAIMTDTDNTRGRATAWYGDIRFAPAAATMEGTTR